MSILEDLNPILNRISQIERENNVLIEMNSRLEGTILAKDVEIMNLNKELNEWKSKKS